MKKLIPLALSLFLAACACRTAEKPLPPVVVPVQPAAAVLPCANAEVSVRIKTAVPCPCAVNTCACAAPNPCRCVYNPNPCRPVLKPRVTETVVIKPRRNCPPDNQMINCGCGNCPVFQQVSTNQPPLILSQKITPASDSNVVVIDSDTVQTVIPVMPEAYVLASNRTASRFIKDTSAYGSNNSRHKIYVKNPVSRSKDLPVGVEKGTANIKHQISNASNFEISDTLTGSDYYLETTVDWLDTPSKNVPAIQYKTALYDRNNNKINEWVEVIKKADNSQSWL